MADKYPRMHSEQGESEQEEMAEGGPEISIPTEEIEGSENWKDGEVYEISMSVRQVGKGKYEILEAEEEESEEKESSEEEKGEGEMEEKD